MPEISISEVVYERVSAFKELVEVVIEEEIDLNTCVELILGQGIDATLADLLSPLDPDTLLKSVQQLGSQHPAQVYGYVAETMSRGADVQARERVKSRLGFHTPSEKSVNRKRETGDAKDPD